MVMVVVMMVPMSGHHDDPWHEAAIRMMMVMVMVPRQLDISIGGFSPSLLIDRLQKHCRVRDRFEQFREGIRAQRFHRGRGGRGLRRT
jgi:hypothetical protein